VGPDFREADRIVIVQFGNWLRTFSSWSAGYGSLGATQEWGAAEVGVAVEVAQPAKFQAGEYVPGDSDVPFSDELVEAVAWLCRHINQELEAAGGLAVPTTHIEQWNQRHHDPIPRGYIGHDELANGLKLGKTDPGQMWDWPLFLRQVGTVVDDSMSPPLSKLDAGFAAWRLGVVPQPRTAAADMYELRIKRR
jgi:N-acetyl-anhydromuramyl-L-alanine amidase AmpD